MRLKIISLFPKLKILCTIKFLNGMKKFDKIKKVKWNLEILLKFAAKFFT